MKRALIIINAYLKLASQFSQAERIKEELQALGVCVDVRRNDEFFALLQKGEIALNVNEIYDFCVYLDKDKYMSEMLEIAGLRLFNTHEAIRVCDDKMQTYIALSGQGIAMPKTLAGLLCYEASESVNEKTLEKIEEQIAYPIIVKESFGSLGKNVFMVNTREELRAIAELLKCRPHLFQEAITSSLGKDVRVIAVGGKVLCAMLRQSKTDFRSNVELGGVGSAYAPSTKIIELCEKVAQLLNLDYCGIDVLFGENGTPVLCEVNSNAFFGGMEKVTGVNVAKAYAEYMYKQTYGEEYEKNSEL